MAKWKNGNGPALWSIDMSRISKVDFVAIPQTDTSSILLEAKIRRESSTAPECPINFKTDTVINDIINALCIRLGRRTPDSIECTKGEPNPDVLRLILEKTLLTIKVPSEQKIKELGEDHKVANEWGICYNDLSSSCIDVEYETIFGDTKVTITKYAVSSRPILIEAKCEQCLITRDDDGTIAGLNERELRNIEWQTGPLICSVKSTMIYSLSVTVGDKAIKTDKITLQRPLEFIFESEYPVFLDDGPEQQQLPKQASDAPIYFDNAKVEENEDEIFLLVASNRILIGSTDNYGPQLVRAVFDRKRKELCCGIDTIDLYEKLTGDTYTSALSEEGKNWGKSKESARFKKAISAAIKVVNDKIGKSLNIANLQVLQLKNKKVSINLDFLSPQLKSKHKF